MFDSPDTFESFEPLIKSEEAAALLGVHPQRLPALQVAEKLHCLPD